MTAAGQRMLVCLRYGIGDVVMELPALRYLRAQWPDAHLTALGAHPATELLQDDPVFDRVVRVQDLGFEHWGDRGDERVRRRAGEWLADHAFGCVLDRAHTVVGMRRVLLDAGIPAYDTGGTVTMGAPEVGGAAVRSIFDSAVDAWGVTESSGPVQPELRIPAEAREAMEAWLQWQRLSGCERIGIAPVASSHLKRWPVARVRELIRRLTTARGSSILVFGIDPAGALAADLRQTAPDHVAIVAPVHLQQTAALIERCHAIIGNDTGLMHIGAAVGTGTVALFGPTSPAVVLPAGARAVSTDTPCGYRQTDRLGPPDCILEDRCLIGAHSCIERIGVDAVEQSVRAVLDGADSAQTQGREMA